jgi:hypothetical protein
MRRKSEARQTLPTWSAESAALLSHTIASAWPPRVHWTLAVCNAHVTSSSSSSSGSGNGE